MRTLRRALAPTALIALAATLLGSATPALAGSSTTWYVGPSVPPTAGLGGGSCDAPGFSDIQAAIDATGPGDTIVVCDGTYVTTLDISGSGHDGLTLRGATAWGATILAPSDGQGGTQLLVSDADAVTIAHLRFKGRDTCVSGMGSAIAVSDSLGVDVRANRIIGGKDSLASGCGFAGGVFVAGSTGRIRYNFIQDWVDDGIYVAGGAPSGGRLLITENILRYGHTGVLGQGAEFRNGIGVLAETPGFRTVISRNVVTVAKTGGLGATDTPTLRAGIGWEADRVTVRGNRVTNAEMAIVGFGGESILVEDNRARGITWDCSDGPGSVWRNNNGRAWKSNPTGLCSLAN